jgi:uncharacterized integral membrane protein (TIGR00698 family)
MTANPLTDYSMRLLLSGFPEDFFMRWIQTHAAGIIFAAILAAAAHAAGKFVPLVGGAVFGIIFGIAVSNIFILPKSTGPGLAFTSKKILQAAIVVLGSGLGLAQVFRTGLSSLLVIVTTISAAFIIAVFVGRILKVNFNLISLIGSGTAICGGSAIAAVAPVIEADDHEIAYAISTVFLFNVIAVLIFPPIGHLLGMTESGFGMFAGTAINDTSSVVAAGYVYGNSAGDYATIVKLTRTIMIIPIAAAFVPIMILRKRKDSRDGGRFSITKIFPWFILGFLAASALNTSGTLSTHAIDILKETGKFMIIMALTAIGLKTDLKKMIHTGYKPALLGLAAWIAVAVTSLMVQKIMGQW